mgnify:CR=1 FL=1
MGEKKRLFHCTQNQKEEPFVSRLSLSHLLFNKKLANIILHESKLQLQPTPAAWVTTISALTLMAMTADEVPTEPTKVPNTSEDVVRDIGFVTVTEVRSTNCKSWHNVISKQKSHAIKLSDPPPPLQIRLKLLQQKELAYQCFQLKRLRRRHQEIQYTPNQPHLGGWWK